MSRKALGGVSARGPMFRIRAVPETARGVTIPAPVEGWDAITPLAAMPETRAITLVNMFPQPGYVEIRKGHKSHSIVGAAAVESLMPYHALNSDGDKLFAACTGNVFDVTAVATATVSADLTGMANARWQHTNFSTSGGNFLWICNGADKPRTYDGSAWATATLTGITSTDVIAATAFKERLWLVRKDQISPAYLEADSVQGTATVFDLVGVFNKGGFLQAIGSWSRDGGDGPDDHIAFITSQGEVAVYTGTDPSNDFLLTGVFEMGAPLGRRCVTKVGADLVVVSNDGVVPLSRALVTDRAAVITATINKLIQPVVNQSARSYGANFGWELVAYPRGTRAILNVPVTENVTQEQYVMNTVTGAWCRFMGENANCWTVFQERLFYGGNDGKVYEADCQGYDENSSIDYEIEAAFNYCGTRGRLKQFTMCRALLTTGGQINPGLAVNVDFERNAPVDIPEVTNDPTALWDSALWDGGVWPEERMIVTDWRSVSGEGYAASIRMAGSVDSAATENEAADVLMQINGWDMLVLDGAFL